MTEKLVGFGPGSEAPGKRFRSTPLERCNGGQTTFFGFYIALFGGKKSNIVNGNKFGYG